MKNKIVDIETKLKDQLLRLLNDLIEIFPQENDILLLRLYFNLKGGDVVMEGFLKWVYPWKEKILEKNEDFFKNNENIFGPLPKNKVKHFTNLINNKLDKNNKETVWAYFKVFILLLDRYKKCL